MLGSGLDACPTFVVGVNGIVRMRRPVAAAWEKGEFEHDMYSLLAQRGVALGFTDFHHPPEVHHHWHQHEAGGDWTQDGSVREVGWLQAGLPAPDSPIPVWPAMACLGDALATLGTLGLTSTHAVLPLGSDTTAHRHFTTTHQWFTLVEPETTNEIGITLRFPGPVPEPEQLAERLGRLALFELRFTILGEPPRAQDLPTGSWLLDDELATLHLGCTAPEWSLDLAAYLTDLVTTGLLDCGVRTPVSVGVQRHVDE